MELSLYVHAPFCVSRCAYCNFYSGEPLAQAGDYLDYALEELKLRLAGVESPKLTTLYLGGGTPSLLGEENIARFLARAQKLCAFAPGCEVTLEVNPTAAIDFNALKEGGVNRVSLGVQALNDRLLKLLGRAHDANTALASVKAAVAAGLNVSCDLMYGYSPLKAEELAQSAQTLADLGISHLSAYSLEEKANCGVEATSEKTEEEHYAELAKTLEGAGFEQYEVSNYARSGRVSRHNKAYWSQGLWLALGPGAQGHDPRAGEFGARYKNAEDLAAWKKALGEGKLPPATVEAPTREEALLETLFLAFRWVNAISVQKLSGKFGILESEFKNVFEILVREGDLSPSPQGYVPTPKGLRRADGLALFVHERLVLPT